MDRADNIEDQWYNPIWAEQGLHEHGKVVNYLNRFGTKDPSRLPRRRSAMPRVPHSRAPQSLMQLNVSKARYHHPGGLEYAHADFARVLNSSPKITESDNYINQEIQANTGIWGHTGY